MGARLTGQGGLVVRNPGDGEKGSGRGSTFMVLKEKNSLSETHIYIFFISIKT